MSAHSYDIEKHPETGVGSVPSEHQSPSPLEDGAVPGESFIYGDSLYAKAQRAAAKFNIEVRGIERVPEEERTETGLRALLNVATMVSKHFQHFAPQDWHN